MLFLRKTEAFYERLKQTSMANLRSRTNSDGRRLLSYHCPVCGLSRDCAKRIGAAPGTWWVAFYRCLCGKEYYVDG